MRRSFGPGMGGGGGGGMMRTVHRAVRAGIGGGAAQEPPYSHSNSATRTTNNRNQQQPNNLCLSSGNNGSPCSYLCNHPIPAANWVFSNAGEEFDWECIEDESKSVNGVYDDFVFDSVPSKDEVHQAVSSLQEVVDPVSMLRMYGENNHFSESGSEIDWIEPSWQVCNSTSTLVVPNHDRIYDAFHLLQTQPSIQRMVISLSSDKAVWDAVMNNEVVRELRESVEQDKGISDGSEDNVDESNPVTQVLRWIFVNAKEKVIGIVEKITKMVNELVQSMGNYEESKKEGNARLDSFQEKLRTSFLLSIMVFLIVVVSRSRNSRS